jgi:hypothetical protein
VCDIASKRCAAQQYHWHTTTHNKKTQSNDKPNTHTREKYRRSAQRSTAIGVCVKSHNTNAQFHAGCRVAHVSRRVGVPAPCALGCRAHRLFSAFFFFFPKRKDHRNKFPRFIRSRAQAHVERSEANRRAVGGSFRIVELRNVNRQSFLFFLFFRGNEP